MAEEATGQVSDWVAGLSVKGYELTRALGDGSPGSPVEAKHVNLDRVVTMLLLEGERGDPAVERFLEAARTQAVIHHPHVLSLSDAGTCPSSGVHYLAFEAVSGQTLQDVLDERGPLPEPEALALTQAVCEALLCLEDQGIVHGDVRPANVWFDAQDTPKLARVGLAPPPGPEEPLDRAHHTAPEVLDGGDVTTRSDLFSLGVMLIRAISGGQPYGGDTWEAIRERQGGELPPEVLVALSEPVRQLVGALCASSPEARYPTAQAANLDFVRVLAGHVPEAGPGPASYDKTSAMEVPRLEDSAGPPGTMPFKVRVSSRGVTLSEYDFDQDTVTIGRSGASDIHIDNPIVSRRHAQIIRKGSRMVLTALSATNVTSRNGKRVEGSVEIGIGDLIVISDKFHLEVTWEPSRAVLPDVPGEDDDTPVVGTPVIRKPPPDDSATPVVGTSRGAVDAVVDMDGPTPVPAVPEDPYGAVGEDDPYDDNPYGEATEPVVTRRDFEPDEDRTPSHAGLAPAVEFSDSQVKHLQAPPQGYLVYKRHGRPVRSFVDKGFQVGSSPACDLRLPRSEPRKVALVVRGVDAYRLYNVGPGVDLVKLNGEPVPDQAVLEVDDQITVCGENLQFDVCVSGGA